MTVVKLFVCREDGAGPSTCGYSGSQFKRFCFKNDAEQWYQANLPPDATGQTRPLPLPQVVYTAPAPDSPDLIAYSDGACLFNGKKGAMAGIGVWWGPGDSRFDIFPLDSSPLADRSSVQKSFGEVSRSTDEQQSGAHRKLPPQAMDGAYSRDGTGNSKDIGDGSDI